MLDTYLIALTTMFATIGPIDVAAVFAAMTAGAGVRAKRAMALRGSVIGAIILMCFALIGDLILQRLGISLPAFRVAGGVLLMLIGINMVFAQHSGGTSTTDDELSEGQSKDDISVFPLATPLIAGPGAMGAIILLMADAKGQWQMQGMVLLGMISIVVATYVSLLAATQLHRLLGVSGAHVIARVFGVMLTALAVQFIFDGLLESGLLNGSVSQPSG